MRFGRFSIADSAGIVLAHSLRAGGRTFRKGRVLSGADAALLEREGVGDVVGARIDADDVAEDAAAHAAAQALAGPGVRVGAPFTGRCNVFASADGLFLVSAPDIDRFNAVDEALTVATLAGPRAVREGEMLATIKVIPFAVPAEVLDRAVAVLGPEPALRVAAFESIPTALIQTRLPATKETVLDKTTRVLRSRIEALGGRVVDEARCDHDAGAVAEAVAHALDAGARLVLIVGASAIVGQVNGDEPGIQAGVRWAPRDDRDFALRQLAEMPCRLEPHQARGTGHQHFLAHPHPPFFLRARIGRRRDPRTSPEAGRVSRPQPSPRSS